MTMKNDTKIDEELTCCFKIDMTNFRNFDPSTRKSKSTEELPFMTLKSYVNFEEKLTCGLKKDLKNLANFHQSTLSRLGL